jgi:ligand-binding sensor domain-containing protein
VRVVPGRRHLDVRVDRLRQSQDGLIWAATTEGVYVDRQEGEGWERLTGHPLLNGPANDVLVTTRGELWVATKQGVLVGQPGAFEAYNEVLLELPELEKSVLPIVLDGEWEGTQLGQVLCLAEDRRRRVWAGTETGPVVWEPESRQWMAYPGRVGEWVWQGALSAVFAPFAPCRDILEDGDGRLWCLTGGQVSVATSSGPWCLWQPGWRVAGPGPGWATYIHFGAIHARSVYGDAAAMSLGPDRHARVLARKGMVLRPPEVPAIPDPPQADRILRPRLDRAATEAAALLSAAGALAYGTDRVFVAGERDGAGALGVGELATAKRDLIQLAGVDPPIRDILYDSGGSLWLAAASGLFELEL